jgi:hypothetical protein
MEAAICGESMSKENLKRKVWEAIDRRSEEIIGLGEGLRSYPELGFKEDDQRGTTQPLGIRKALTET